MKRESRITNLNSDDIILNHPDENKRRKTLKRPKELYKEGFEVLNLKRFVANMRDEFTIKEEYR